MASLWSLLPSRTALLPLASVRFASKKSGGSTKNTGGNSPGRRYGFKKWVMSGSGFINNKLLYLLFYYSIGKLPVHRLLRMLVSAVRLDDRINEKISCHTLHGNFQRIHK
uniref:Uncharacterized protein n=1 Tax=Nothobranchius furzeri TaxID=105023 RepID=A0A8C6M6K8_NOTFU